jgi:hypothetical protein
VAYMNKLHHIGLGRAHKGRQVKLLIADQSVRVIALDGELIRELTLDPSRDYQPLARLPVVSAGALRLVAPKTTIFIWVAPVGSRSNPWVGRG